MYGFAYICEKDRFHPIIEQAKRHGYIVKISPYMPAGFAILDGPLKTVHVDLAKGTEMDMDLWSCSMRTYPKRYATNR